MKTVLVVEDDLVIAAILTTVLEEEGYQVRTAADANAIPIAIDEHPSVILLDLNLPGIDGVEISRHLRNDPRTRDIPIVLMSASEQLAKRGHQAPVDGLLAKPFELDTLMDYVDHLAGDENSPPQGS